MSSCNISPSEANTIVAKTAELMRTPIKSANVLAKSIYGAMVAKFPNSSNIEESRANTLKLSLAIAYSLKYLSDELLKVEVVPGTSQLLPKFMHAHLGEDFSTLPDALKETSAVIQILKYDPIIKELKKLINDYGTNDFVQMFTAEDVLALDQHIQSTFSSKHKYFPVLKPVQTIEIKEEIDKLNEVSKSIPGLSVDTVGGKKVRLRVDTNGIIHDKITSIAKVMFSKKEEIKFGKYNIVDELGAPEFRSVNESVRFGNMVDATIKAVAKIRAIKGISEIKDYRELSLKIFSVLANDSAIKFGFAEDYYASEVERTILQMTEENPLLLESLAEDGTSIIAQNESAVRRAILEIVNKKVGDTVKVIQETKDIAAIDKLMESSEAYRDFRNYVLNLANIAIDFHNEYADWTIIPFNKTIGANYEVGVPDVILKHNTLQSAPYKIVEIKASLSAPAESTSTSYNVQASRYSLMMKRLGFEQHNDSVDVYFVMGRYEETGYNGKKQYLYVDMLRRTLKATAAEYVKQKQTNEATYREMIVGSGFPEWVLPKILETELNEPVTLKDGRTVIPTWRYLDVVKKVRSDENQALDMKYLPGEAAETADAMMRQEQWFKNTFPELGKDGLRFVPIFNSEASGKFIYSAERLGVDIFSNATEGVIHHESWHVFSQLYLTKEEKEKLYKDIQKRAIPFTTRKGVVGNTATSSYLQVEEFLAEEFRKFAKDPGNYKLKETRTIFQKILDAIKAILKKRDSLNPYTLFNNLYNSKMELYKTNYSIDNILFNTLNSDIYSENGDDVIPSQAAIQGIDIIHEVMSELFYANDTNVSTDFNSFQEGLDTRVLLPSTFARIAGKENDIVEASKTVSKKITSKLYRAIYDRILQESSNPNSKFARANELLLSLQGNYQYSDNIIPYEELIKKRWFTEMFTGLIQAAFTTSRHEKIKQLTRSKKDIARISESVEYEDKEETFDENKEGNETDELPFNKSGNEDNPWTVIKGDTVSLFEYIPRQTAAANSISYYDEINQLSEFMDPREAFNKFLEVASGLDSLDEIFDLGENETVLGKFPQINYILSRLKNITDKAIRINEILTNNKTLRAWERRQLELERRDIIRTLRNFVYATTLSKISFRNLVINKEALTRTIENKYKLQQSGSVSEATGDRVFTLMSPVEKSVDDQIGRWQSAFVYNSNFNEYDESIDVAKEEMYDKIKELAYSAENSNTLEQFIQGVFDSLPVYFMDSGKAMHYFNHFSRSYLYSSDATGTDLFKTLGITIPSQMLDASIDGNAHAALKQFVNTFRENHSKNIMQSILVEKLKKRLTREGYGTPQQQIKKIVDDIDAGSDAAFNFIREMMDVNPFSSYMSAGELKALSEASSVTFRGSLGSNYGIVEKFTKYVIQYANTYNSHSVYTENGKNTEYGHSRTSPQLKVRDAVINQKPINKKGNDVIAHLDFTDPASSRSVMKNSRILKAYYNEDGTRKEVSDHAKYELYKMSEMLTKDGEVMSSPVKDMTPDEKLFMIIMSQMLDSRIVGVRRHEASNSDWLMQLPSAAKYTSSYSGYDGNDTRDLHVKALESPALTEMMKGYLKIAIAQHLHFANNPELIELNKKALSENPIGIFDDIFSADQGNSFVQDLKLLIEEYFEKHPAVNDTNIDKFLSTLTPNTQQRINDAYFQFFKNKYDGVLKLIENNKLMEQVFYNPESKSIDYGKFHGISLFSNDSLRLLDYVINDFIGVMEESILTFGDWSLYIDAIKRRKMSSNNGSTVNNTGFFMESFAEEDYQNSIEKMYLDAKGLTNKRKSDRLRKAVIESMPVIKYSPEQIDAFVEKLFISKHGDSFAGNKEEELQKIRREKKGIIDALLKGIDTTDGSGIVSLDHYRKMMEPESYWEEKDDAEVERQKLFVKAYLHPDKLTLQEVERMNSAPISKFNIGKFATTGMILNDTNGTPLPNFDKMALSLLMPEDVLGHAVKGTYNVLIDPSKPATDDNITKATIYGPANPHPLMYLFDIMNTEQIDYFVFDSGTKAMQPKHTKALSHTEGGAIKVDKNAKVTVHEHALDAHKMQINTRSINDSLKSASQQSHFIDMLRSVATTDAEKQALDKSADKLMQLEKELLQETKIEIAKKYGIEIKYDQSGEIESFNLDPTLFSDYVRRKLLAEREVDSSIINLLQVDHTDRTKFKIPIETLPGQLREKIEDIKTGILKEFKHLKVYGSKLWQQPADFTNHANRDEIPFHDIVNGKTIASGIKIAFRENHKALFRLKYKTKEGNILRIDQSENGKKKSFKEKFYLLQSLMQDKKWVEQNERSFKMVGVRIPLQQFSFMSAYRAVEFMLPVFGDTAALAKEQIPTMGTDFDADTLYTEMYFLDTTTGKPLTRGGMSKQNVIERLEEAKKKYQELKTEKGVKREAVSADIIAIQERFNAEVSVLLKQANTHLAHEMQMDGSLIVHDIKLTFDIANDTFDFNSKFYKKVYEPFLKKGTAIQPIQDFIESVEEMLQEAAEIREADETLSGEIGKLNSEIRKLSLLRSNYSKAIMNERMDAKMELLEHSKAFYYKNDVDTTDTLDKIAAINLAVKQNPEETDPAKIKEIANRLLASFNSPKDASGKRKISAADTTAIEHDVDATENHSFRKFLGSFVNTVSAVSTAKNANVEFPIVYADGSNRLKKSTTNLRAEAAHYKVESIIPFENTAIEGQSADGTRYRKLPVVATNGMPATSAIQEGVAATLDLFKKTDTFPNLGINTYDHANVHIYLSVFGVDNETINAYMMQPALKKMRDMVEQTRPAGRGYHGIGESYALVMEQLIAELSEELRNKLLLHLNSIREQKIGKRQHPHSKYLANSPMGVFRHEKQYQIWANSIRPNFYGQEVLKALQAISVKFDKSQLEQDRLSKEPDALRQLLYFAAFGILHNAADEFQFNIVKQTKFRNKISGALTSSVINKQNLNRQRNTAFVSYDSLIALREKTLNSLFNYEDKLTGLQKELFPEINEFGDTVVNALAAITPLLDAGGDLFQYEKLQRDYISDFVHMMIQNFVILDTGGIPSPMGSYIAAENNPKKRKVKENKLGAKSIEAENRDSIDLENEFGKTGLNSFAEAHEAFKVKHDMLSNNLLIKNLIFATKEGGFANRRAQISKRISEREMDEIMQDNFSDQYDTEEEFLRANRIEEQEPSPSGVASYSQSVGVEYGDERIKDENLKHASIIRYVGSSEQVLWENSSKDNSAILKTLLEFNPRNHRDQFIIRFQGESAANFMKRKQLFNDMYINGERAQDNVQEVREYARHLIMQGLFQANFHGSNPRQFASFIPTTANGSGADMTISNIYTGAKENATKFWNSLSSGQKTLMMDQFNIFFLSKNTRRFMREGGMVTYDAMTKTDKNEAMSIAIQPYRKSEAYAPYFMLFEEEFLNNSWQAGATGDKFFDANYSRLLGGIEKNAGAMRRDMIKKYNISVVSPDAKKIKFQPFKIKNCG